MLHVTHSKHSVLSAFAVRIVLVSRLQYFGQVQYMETGSVAAAVEGANGTRWHGAVIQVVPHHKAAQVER